MEGAAEIVEALRNDELDAAYGAVAWWNDMPHSGPRAVGPGLLVKKIRDGGLVGYKRPHERATPDGEGGLGKKRLRSIRGVLLSPDCAFTRKEAEKFYEHEAEKVGTTPTALIDAAMGIEWSQTPPHPASRSGWSAAGWKYPDDLHAQRYALWVGTDRAIPQARDGARQPGESDWDFAVRFWGWRECEDELQDALRKAAAREEMIRQRAAEEAAQKAAQVERELEEAW